MNSERQVYLLNPKVLNPETIAVAFAKTSRSPQSFKEIAAELTDEKSAQFHEKWVVGYGHASVAEHAILHIAIENVSRLAIESIESNRLASYTEKSTRYQKWSPNAFHIPSELADHSLLPLYIDTCQKLFNAYQVSIPAVRAVVEAEAPRREEESESAWDRRIRSEYVDVSRFLLPAASLANLGMTANARVLESAIRKFLSHPLDEVRSIGRDIKHVSQAEVPTLVKYANRVPYLENTAQALTQEASLVSPSISHPTDWCQLVDYDPQGELNILSAALYRFGNMGHAEALAYVHKRGPDGRTRLAEDLLGSLEDHDTPLREMEHTTYTFDVMVDQGAFFELKRHRMMSQSPQNLTTCHGYTLPLRIVQAGFEEQYIIAMDTARETYEKLAEDQPHVAAYVVPNGYLRRVLLTLNLRTAFHLCALRSASNAHFSMRRLALRMAEQICQVHPLLGAYLRVEGEDTWQSLSARYFA